MLASTMLLGVGLALQELSQNLILLGHQLLTVGAGGGGGGTCSLCPRCCLAAI
jgi:hypothetical protein